MSSNATLRVLTIGQALAHRYSFANDASDSVGGAHGTLQGAAAINAGQLALNGTAGTYVNLPPHMIDGLPATTFEAWVSFGVNGNFPRLFDFGNTNLTAGIRYMFFTHRAGNATTLRSAIIEPLVEKNVSATGSLDTKTNVHIACVFDPQSGFMGFYTNGVLAGSRTDLATLTNVDNALSFIGRSVFAADAPLNASIDEFRIYSTRLSAQQIATNFVNGPNAPINGGPLALTADVPDRTVSEADPVTLSITANGDGPIGYQWYRNGSPVANATNTYLSFPSALVNDNGAQFSVVASNYVATNATSYMITSRVATLTVLSAANSLTHRWAFDGDVTDSIGGATCSTNNAGGPLPKLTNGAVVLNGAGQFVDLPNNLVATYNSMTVEAWVTDNGSGTWGRIMDFGNSSAGEGVAGAGNDNCSSRHRAAVVACGVRSPMLPEAASNSWKFCPMLRAWACAVTSFGLSTPQDGFPRFMLDGVQVASNVAFTQTPGMGPTLNNWLGRWQYSGDAFFAGSIHDFRLYNSALSVPILGNSSHSDRTIDCSMDRCR